MDYVLIYSIDGPWELGGGLRWESFESLDLMTDKVNLLLEENGQALEIEAALQVRDEITYKPVTTVTKMEPDI